MADKMTMPPIEFNAIKSLKELHQVLKSRKIKLEAECSLEELGQPITFVKNHIIPQRTLTDQALRFLRRSSVVKFNRDINSRPPFIDNNLLKEYEEFEKYDDSYQLRMLVDGDIQAGVARVHKKTKNNRKLIDALYSTLDLIFHTPELNKVLEAYIKPNFSKDQITTCVNEIKKSNQLELSLEYDDELRPKLVKWAIEDGYSLEEELMDFRYFATKGYCVKTHKILMLPIIEFLLSHFKKLEVWEISNDTTYYIIRRPCFFIGIFGYTHDGQFDGVVYKGYNER